MTTRRRFRRSGGRRKRTQWTQLSPVFPHVAAADTFLADLTPEPMASSLEGTAKILRFLANFTITQTAAENATNEYGVGVAVLGHEAFDGLAVPDPLVGDFSQGWYYQTERAYQRTAAGGGMLTWEVDIRTSRVLRAGYKLVMVSRSPVNPVAITVRVGIRMLWEIN